MKISVFAFDRSTVRTIDDFGRMHVAASNISKATVNPYFGREIPRWQQLGLTPNRVYNLLRHPDELAKAAPSFNNLPILDEHIPVTANDHAKTGWRHAVVGTTGTDAVFEDGYLKNSLAVWVQLSIDRINDNSQRELSSGYAYDADMTPGIHEGLHFDGVMRNIKGNHVTLVKLGRAGRDVMVGDAELEIMPVALKSRKALMLHGALTALVSPLMASDKAIDFSGPLDTIDAENMGTNTQTLATAIVAATEGNLAADKTLTVDDVVTVINEVNAIKLAADEVDLLAAPAVPPVPPVITQPVISAVPPIPSPAGPPAITQDALNSAVADAQKSTIERMNAIRTAERDVHPFIGEIKTAMDSADAIYKLAFDHLKVNVVGVDPSAYPALLAAQPNPNAPKPRVSIAADHAAGAKSFRERFPNAVALVRG